MKSNSSSAEEQPSAKKTKEHIAISFNRMLSDKKNLVNGLGAKAAQASNNIYTDAYILQLKKKMTVLEVGALQLREIINLPSKINRLNKLHLLNLKRLSQNITSVAASREIEYHKFAMKNALFGSMAHLGLNGIFSLSQYRFGSALFFLFTLLLNQGGLALKRTSISTR